MKYNTPEQVLSIVKKTVAPIKDRIFDVDLSIIENVIYKKIPDVLKNNAPMNYPELYFSFCEEYERFKTFLIYEPLIGKRVVALGGGFSSGKSSFINALLGKTKTNDKGKERLVRFLPAQTDPTTSVPTYIVYGENDDACGINIFNNRISYELSDIEPLSHGFGKTENDTEAIKLGQMLKSLFIATSLQEYHNIAFLDTPGYSKAETDDYSDKTDEKIAMEQLRTADCIMWFMRADKGTLQESDIDFLKRMDKSSTPLIIIITAADIMTDDNLKAVIDVVKSVAIANNISCQGVFAISSKLTHLSDYDMPALKNYLKTWDKPIDEQNFAYNFSLLFIKCREYLQNEQALEKQRLEKLNTSSLKVTDNDVSFIINGLTKQSREKITQINTILDELSDLRSEFFTELRRLSSVIGIKLPEADEVSIATDSINNTKGPAKAAEKVCAMNGNKYDAIERILLSYIDDDNSEIPDSPFEIGGTSHQDRIYGILSKYLD